MTSFALKIDFFKIHTALNTSRLDLKSPFEQPLIYQTKPPVSESDELKQFKEVTRVRKEVLKAALTYIVLFLTMRSCSHFLLCVSDGDAGCVDHRRRPSCPDPG